MKTTPTAYKIIINMRLANGYTETGQFFISHEVDAAFEIFDQLQGTPHHNPTAMLRLDLVALGEGLGTVLKTLDCTLTEMTENIRIIICQTFRLVNLE
jgi:hypothetical protein